MAKAERESDPGGIIGKSLRLLYELSISDLDICQIAEVLDASERTAYRYVERLNTLSAHDAGVVNHNGRFGLRRRRELAEILGGSMDELAIAAITSSALGGLIAGKSAFADRVLDKVRPILDVSKGVGADSLLKSLFEALLATGRSVSIDYLADAGTKQITCVPVRLYIDPVQVYLVAWEETRGYMICLATSKMVGVPKLDRPAMASARYKELQDYCRSAWGKMIRHDSMEIAHAVFLAAPSIAPHFRKNKLRLDQGEEELTDGRVRISLPVHNPIEFVRYILRFGEAIRIEGDDEILQEMRNFLAAMRRAYET